MAKETFVLAIDIEARSTITPFMLERYISRAVRNYYEHDPECLFERGEKPSVTVVSETLNPEEVRLLKNYMEVAGKMILKKDIKGKGKIV